MAHGRRLDEGKFCCVVIGGVIGQISAGKELLGGEKSAMNGVVVSVRLDEILDRESAGKIFVPGHGRAEMTEGGFACVLDDLHAPVALQQPGQQREIIRVLFSVVVCRMSRGGLGVLSLNSIFESDR